MARIPQNGSIVFGLWLRVFCLIPAMLAFAMGAVSDNTAQAAGMSIAMAKDRWPSDQRIDFTLFADPENGQEPTIGLLPDHVGCTLESDDRTHTLIARRIAATETAEASAVGQRLQARYGFDPPADLRGTVRMRILEIQVPVILFEIGPPRQDTAAVDTHPSLDSLFVLYQPYIGNIGAYEPMYFLVGTEPEKSKFQISFNYRFFNSKSELATWHPWVKGFHFGYTQTSFWDLESDSVPFSDTSYKPELFWVSKDLAPSGSSITGFFMQTGYQHESNGLGDDDSRSTNFLYVQPIFIFFHETSHYGLQIAPKIWTYVNNDNTTNPDLDKYRGYFDLGIKIGKMDGFVLDSSFRWAAEGASIQMDLTYPVHRFLSGTLDIYLHAQYSNALAESMIDYRDRTHAFRLGFSVVR